MVGGGTSEGGRSLAAVDEDGDASSSDTSSQDGIPDELHSRLGAHGVGSIASTYWRPERRDRGGLSILDERCVPTNACIPEVQGSQCCQDQILAVRTNRGLIGALALVHVQLLIVQPWVWPQV